MTQIEIQKIAKETMKFIKTKIKPGLKLSKIKAICEDEMKTLGATSFWYHGIGALCFAGDETAISISGNDYKVSNRVIQKNDIITIDLCPCAENCYGDYAQTIIVENGKVIEKSDNVSNPEWRCGLFMEERLHGDLIRFANVNTTFAELFRHTNAFIIESGYINLDYQGNLGHSLSEGLNGRVFIENANKTKLSDVPYFSFLPHIGVKDSCYGFKEENIYYFKDGYLHKL